MSEKLIDLTIADRIGRLVINRAEAANAFTGDMLGEVTAALNRAASEADILVISSAGEDFTLGRDRKDTPRPPFDAFTLVTDFNTALSGFPGILITEIQGRAYGLGVGIVMRSDMAIAAADAHFALDEIKLGIAPMFIMAEILEHLSPKAALDIMLTSRDFTADEAREMGVVSRVVPADKLKASVEELVAELKSRDASVLKISKRYLQTVKKVPPEGRASFALAEQTRFILAKHK